jgi:hypothetical protein
MSIQNQWVRVSTVAREYNKSAMTIKRWCASGFMFRLGYRVKKDPKGQWLVSQIQPEQTAQPKHSPLTQ